MEATARGIHRRVVFSVDDSLRKRFDAKFVKRGDADCWQWVGAVRNGYGAIKHGNHTLSSHVVAYVMATNKHPRDGEIICHTCDNRLCVNPAHLYVGSYSDNVRDADKRRRIPRPHGEQVYNSVLTDDVCRLIFSLNIVRGLGPWLIADTLGYHKRTIEKALYAETWKHVAIPSHKEATQIVAEWERKRGNQ